MKSEHVSMRDLEKDILGEALARHRKVLEESIPRILPDVQRGADILRDLVKRNGRLFLCGNGGSAADSQHFAAEWLCKYRGDRAPLPAIALTTDTSTMTAIGNDYGFEDIFSRQIEALGKEGDVLVALTTSGQSKNILRAIAQAKKQGLKVIALTGARGAHLKTLTDLAIIIPSDETARIQEMHELIYHAWCEYVDASL
jgi:D-sedoheptulose 7-phosphate isomerase